MRGIFNSSIFNDEIFNIGIGLDDEAGIGLAARPPIDFVTVGVPGQGYQKVAYTEKLRAARREKVELQEMINLYARWKKAA